VCHYAGRGIIGVAAVFALLLALAFTHEGGVVLALAIFATLALRGWRDPAFLRAAAVLPVVMAIWASVAAALPAEGYFAEVLRRAGWSFFDLSVLESPMALLVAAALCGYAIC